MSIRIIDDFVSLKTQFYSKFDQITVSNIEVIGYHPFAFLKEESAEKNLSSDKAENPYELLIKSFQEQIKAKDELISELRDGRSEAIEKIHILSQQVQNEPGNFDTCFK